MREHISVQYDQELESIRAHLIEMAGIVERQLEQAGQALLRQDSEPADAVIAADVEVNRLEVTIDDLGSHVIVRRQPTASDLRFILVTLKSITDLERIGDECTRIAKMAVGIAGRKPLRTRFTELDEIIHSVEGMLRDGLRALFRVDTEVAADVIARDKGVDRTYRTLVTRITAEMEKDPEDLRSLLDLLWCARSLERIGDHAKNIAEYVVYLGHGQDIRHQPLETKQREALGASRDD